jgi:hypothetical protein
MRKHPDEIVYVESRPGQMESEADRRARIEYWDRIWDRAGPWMLPALAVVLTLNYLVGEWLR